MPLLYSFNINKGISVYMWEIKESLMDLKKEVFLSSFDQIKMQKLKSLEHKKGFLATRNLFKLAITETDNANLDYNSEGAPILNNGKYISMTHSKNYAGIAIGQNKLGIDLEVYQEKIMSIAPKFINDEEKFIFNFSSVIKGLTLIWTAKEAIYKAVSTKGIYFGRDIIISPFKIEDKNGSAKLFLNQKEEKFSLIFVVNNNFCSTLAIKLNK